MAKHEQQAYECLGAKVLTLPDVIRRSASSELSDLTKSTA